MFFILRRRVQRYCTAVRVGKNKKYIHGRHKFLCVRNKICLPETVKKLKTTIGSMRASTPTALFQNQVHIDCVHCCRKEKTMEFEMIKPLWRERKGFSLSRASIGDRYIFIHFLTPVTATLRGAEVRISPGGCVIWAKNTPQQFRSDECELVHDWFHAMPDCEELLSEFSLECERVYYPQHSEEITKIFAETETEIETKNIFYERVCNANTERLFAMLARSAAENRAAPSPRKQEFDRARAAIRSECMNDWTVADMARIVNMSESAFYRNYKAIYGITPQSDLAAARIERARILLMRDRLSVSDAAEMCGYHNQYHFIRTFKKFVGTTPGKYRNSSGR